MNIIQVYQRFPTEKDCIAYLETVRWKGLPVCPYCGSNHATAMPRENRYHCNACYTTFSVTVNSIFHQSHLPLPKWFLAIFLILDGEMSISIRRLAKILAVNKNTAWNLKKRIHKAMTNSGERALLLHIVETVDLRTSVQLFTGW